ncbi:MAG TPA: prephenate dehydratase [Acidobacteriaceae bacterium]|nr:prephenate dehydratase [Acidobacteriaceae bacterium]
MQVGIQGELGSFSHEASLILLPEGEIVPCAAAGAVLEALDSDRVDAAVIPVENSLAGSVMDFYDLFFAHEFFVERELEMRIRHNLMVAQGVTLGTVRQVLSHPVALAQCKGFFSAHPQLEAIAFYDTAGAVRHVSESRQNHLGAIGSKQAARQYGASILQEGIEDREESYTRFWLIRRHSSAPTEEAPTKLSVAFVLENRPGALLHALNTFAARQLNLTKIESRPITGHPWEYMFFADVTIPGSEEADAALLDLRKVCSTVKELGRYRVLNSASNR